MTEEQLTGKSRWQLEYEALPEWARKIVDGLAGRGWYGMGGGDAGPERTNVFIHAAGGRAAVLMDGIHGAVGLAGALTAPWPPPPAPVRGLAGDGCVFGQACAFGCRAEDDPAAVYCHNEGWPDAPRMCRRNRVDYRHENCPGFVPNPDFHG